MSFASETEFALSFIVSWMLFYRLRLKYALEGSSNYISWKDRMEAVLEDNELKEFINKDIPKPPTTIAQDLSR